MIAPSLHALLVAIRESIQDGGLHECFSGLDPEASAWQAAGYPMPVDERALCIRLARGCVDYNGGHDGPELDAFHHGIQTVVNVLTAPTDHQTRVVEHIGGLVEAAEPTPADVLADSMAALGIVAALRATLEAHGYTTTTPAETVATIIEELGATRINNRKLRDEATEPCVHVAICIACGERTTCDEDRACSCGRDLIVCADRYSAELLLEMAAEGMAEDWREAVEEALGVEPSEEHNVEWAGKTVLRLREDGNAHPGLGLPSSASVLRALAAELARGGERSADAARLIHLADIVGRGQPGDALEVVRLRARIAELEAQRATPDRGPATLVAFLRDFDDMLNRQRDDAENSLAVIVYDEMITRLAPLMALVTAWADDRAGRLEVDNG